MWKFLAARYTAIAGYYCKDSWGICWTQPGCEALGSGKPGNIGECWRGGGTCTCIAVPAWVSGLMIVALLLLIAALLLLVGPAFAAWLWALLAKGVSVEAVTAGITAAIAILNGGGSEDDAKAAIERGGA
jgi:hypothetical protein